MCWPVKLSTCYELEMRRAGSCRDFGSGSHTVTYQGLFLQFLNKCYVTLKARRVVINPWYVQLLELICNKETDVFLFASWILLERNNAVFLLVRGSFLHQLSFVDSVFGTQGCSKNNFSVKIKWGKNCNRKCLKGCFWAILLPEIAASHVDSHLSSLWNMSQYPVFFTAVQTNQSDSLTTNEQSTTM